MKQPLLGVLVGWFFLFFGSIISVVKGSMNGTLSLFERIVWTSRAAEDSQQIHLNYLE